MSAPKNTFLFLTQNLIVTMVTLWITGLVWDFGAFCAPRAPTCVMPRAWPFSNKGHVTLLVSSVCNSNTARCLLCIQSLLWLFTRTYQRQRLREQLYGFSCKSLVTLKAMSIVSTDSSEVHSVCACVYSSVWKRAAWCYSKIEIVKIHPGWLFESLFPLLCVDPLTRWSAGRFLPR